MPSGAGSDDAIEVRETDRLIASDKVEGTAVFDREGNRLGAIQNVMIDKVTGQVAYATLGFGGFLGIGEHYHPLPWSMLAYDTGRGGYVVDVTRAHMEQGPTHARDEAPWSSNPDYGREVYSHYGLPYDSGV